MTPRTKGNQDFGKHAKAKKLSLLDRRKNIPDGNISNKLEREPKW